jgi:hypothetical protein
MTCQHEWTNAYGLAPKFVKCKHCGAIGGQEDWEKPND